MKKGQMFWVPNPAPSDGIVGDVNTMRVDPSHLGNAQDVVLDTSGVLRNRGAVSLFSSDTFVGNAIAGMAQLPLNALSNAGTILLTKDTSNNVYLYGTSASALTGFSKLTVGTSSGTQVLSSASFFAPSWARLPDDRGFVGACNNTNNGYNNWSYAFIWGGNAVTTSDTTTGTAASTIHCAA